MKLVNLRIRAVLRKSGYTPVFRMFVEKQAKAH